MKKILIVLFLIINSFTFVNAGYIDFIDSPDKDDLISIEDENVRYCEEIYLRFSRRWWFTTEQNEKCRNVFARKIEAEMEYKRMVFSLRWVY